MIALCYLHLFLSPIRLQSAGRHRGEHPHSKYDLIFRGTCVLSNFNDFLMSGPTGGPQSVDDTGVIDDIETACRRGGRGSGRAPLAVARGGGARIGGSWHVIGDGGRLGDPAEGLQGVPCRPQHIRPLRILKCSGLMIDDERGTCLHSRGCLSVAVMIVMRPIYPPDVDLS